MATPDEVQGLRKVCETLAAIPTDRLLSRPAWGEVTFQQAAGSIERIRFVLDHLATLPLELIPSGNFSPLRSAADSAVRTITQIDGFTLSSVSAPIAHRDSLVSQVAQEADQLTIAVSGWLPFLAYQRGDITQNITRLTGAASQAEKALEDAKVTISAKEAELDKIITAAREAAATAGVGHFTEDFRRMAGDNKRTAENWLKATGGFAAATLIVAVLMVFIPIPVDASRSLLTQLFTSKVAVLLVLIGATIWCGRIYRATRHQEAINSHRASALKTFQAFIQATDDEPTRNAVLLETTRSIFAIAPTGLLDGVDGGGDPGLRMLEVVKNVTSTKSGS